MKTICRTCLVAAIFAASFLMLLQAWAQTPKKSNTPRPPVEKWLEDLKNERTSMAILKKITEREKQLVKITENPFSNDVDWTRYCEANPEPRALPVENPHRGHSLLAYVSSIAEKTIREGKDSYVTGSFILKEKLPGVFAVKPPEVPNFKNDDEMKAFLKERLKTPELFTAMLKREPGYNPDCGDWEFLVIDGRATQVLARGKIESCMDCHKDYKATDYVTRAYLPAVTENKPAQ